MIPSPAPGPWNDEREIDLRQMERFEVVMLVLLLLAGLGILIVGILVAVNWGYQHGH